MRIADIYKKKMPISFEIFPPKGEIDIDSLKSMLSDIKQLSPDFVSVTYSAGGTGNSGNTSYIAGMIKNDFKMNACAHLTCINADKEKIDSEVASLEKNGVGNILALRGDIVGDNKPKDFFHCCDLISHLKGKNICIGAACYPEGHISCESIEKDIEYMKLKEEMGAEFFISQLFFENDIFYRFIEKIRSAGIKSPVDAGIMPFLSKSQISRMIFMCGASLPAKIIRLLNKYENSPEDLKKAGIEYAGSQILDLARHGVDGIHIYTMNNKDIAKYETELLRNDGF